MVSETPSRISNHSVCGSNEAAIAREKNGDNADIFISPRFKSAAALAGWDEEDLIISSFVVDDSPEISSSKRRRRFNLLFKTTPPSSGSRRRQRIKQSSIPLPVVDLDEVIRREEETSAENKNKNNRETKTETQEEKRIEKDDKMVMVLNPFRHMQIYAIKT